MEEWWNHWDICCLVASSPLVLWGHGSGRASGLSRWCHSDGDGIIIIITTTTL